MSTNCLLEPSEVFNLLCGCQGAASIKGGHFKLLDICQRVLFTFQIKFGWFKNFVRIFLYFNHLYKVNCKLIKPARSAGFSRIKKIPYQAPPIRPEPLGLPSGSGHFLPYIPPLVLIRIHYPFPNNGLLRFYSCNIT